MKRKLAWNIIYTLEGYAFSFLTIMYISRVLGPDSLGKVSFASAFVGYFALFAGVGIPMYAFRECAGMKNEPSKLSKSIKELILLGLAFSAVAYFLLVTSLFSVPALLKYRSVCLLLGIGMFLAALRSDWLFRGLEKWEYRTLTTLLFSIIAFSLMILFVREADDWLIYALLTMAVPVMSTGINLLYIRRRYIVKAPIKEKLEPFRHLRASLRFLMMSCMVSIYNQLDILMLGFMQSDLIVGYYSIATRIKAVLTATGGIIWNVNLPQAVRLCDEKNHGALQSLTKRGMRLVLFAQIPVFVFSLVHAAEMVEIVSGSGYVKSILPLQILIFTIPPIAVSNILGGQVLIPAGLEKDLLKSETIGMVINLALNALLIPGYSMYGAAAATVVSEVAVSVMTVVYAKKKLGICIFEKRGILEYVCLTMISLAVSECLIMKSLKNLMPNALCSILLSGISFFLVYGGLFYVIRRTRIVDECKYLLSKIFIPSRMKRHYCTCCGRHFTKFISGRFKDEPLLYNSERYEHTRQDVICPYCRSLPRHRIIAGWAEQNRDFLRKARILYFAAEASMKKWFIRNHIGITTADLFAKADIKLDITNIDLPDCSYDVVFCNHVLEHVSDYSSALSELYRIIAPGGKLIICFPIDMKFETVFEVSAETAEKRVELFGQHDHLRIFGRDSSKILENVGFEVNTIHLDEMPENIMPVIGPADYDSNIIFCCSKA